VENSELQRFGRNGQKQKGVDIFGADDQGRLAGVSWVA